MLRCDAVIVAVGDADNRAAGSAGGIDVGQGIADEEDFRRRQADFVTGEQNRVGRRLRIRCGVAADDGIEPGAEFQFVEQLAGQFDALVGDHRQLRVTLRQSPQRIDYVGIRPAPVRDVCPIVVEEGLQHFIHKGGLICTGRCAL